MDLPMLDGTGLGELLRQIQEMSDGTLEEKETEYAQKLRALLPSVSEKFKIDMDKLEHFVRGLPRLERNSLLSRHPSEMQIQEAA